MEFVNSSNQDLSIMFSNISFNEESRKLKIDIGLSCVSRITSIFVFLIFLFCSLCIIAIGFVALVSSFTEHSSNIFAAIISFSVGLIFLYVGVHLAIQTILNIRFYLRKTIECLEISDRIFKISLVDVGLDKKANQQISGQVKYITKVKACTYTKRSTTIYDIESKYKIHYCSITNYGQEYRFGQRCQLSDLNACLITRRINRFLEKIR